MFTRRLLTATALIAATALTGCGRASMTAAPLSRAASNPTAAGQVLPNAYQEAAAQVAQPDPTPAPVASLTPEAEVPTATEEETAATEETTADEDTTVADEETTADDETATTAGVEATLVSVAKKKSLLLPESMEKLIATVKVTNASATETLSTVVQIDFINTTGLIKKTDKVVETKLQPIANLAPGQTLEFQVTSTKAAKAAEVSIAE